MFTSQTGKTSFLDAPIPQPLQITVPAVPVTASEVTTVVPLLKGPVDVQVIEQSGGTNVQSNSVQIIALPSPEPTGPPGQTTLDGLQELLGDLQSMQQDIKGPKLDSPTVEQAVSREIQQIQTLISQVRQVAPGGNGVQVGTADGIPMVLDQDSLRILDRLIYATEAALQTAVSQNQSGVLLVSCPPPPPLEPGAQPSQQAQILGAAILSLVEIGDILIPLAQKQIISGLKKFVIKVIGVLGPLTVYLAIKKAVKTLKLLSTLFTKPCSVEQPTVIISSFWSPDTRPFSTALARPSTTQP